MTTEVGVAFPATRLEIVGPVASAAAAVAKVRLVETAVLPAASALRTR
jgi:hypothetical protein